MKLALFELLKDKPDLVLSGINHGPNLGTDVFCSGTVAAAMEGTLEGIRSLAVSSACFQWREFQVAADLAMDVSEQALRDQWPKNMLLNLNIPPCAKEAMGTLGWTRLSIRRYDEQFSARQDPRGRTYYWLAGEVVKDLNSAGEGPRDWPSDVAQIHNNSPSITPIQPDLFWRGPLADIPQLNVGPKKLLFDKK
jgi:5'-nucleotidase